jgi:hypothetical protein
MGRVRLAVFLRASVEMEKAALEEQNARPSPGNIFLSTNATAPRCRTAHGFMGKGFSWDSRAKFMWHVSVSKNNEGDLHPLYMGMMNQARAMAKLEPIESEAVAETVPDERRCCLYWLTLRGSGEYLGKAASTTLARDRCL